MITSFPFSSLGKADFGWLKANYHFSFSRYYNPQRMGFGVLRVINDDRVAAGTGFNTHGHDNMEIITYVRSGAISHEDSEGNKGRTGAGDVQVMSAGSGIQHSEHNHENEDTTLYQIWIEPNRVDVSPRWEMRQFPKEPISSGNLQVLASGRAEDIAAGALMIHQDAAISGGRIKADGIVSHPVKHQAYLLVSEGQVVVGEKTLNKGDGAEITGEKQVKLKALRESEVLLIDVPQESQMPAVA